MKRTHFDFLPRLALGLVLLAAVLAFGCSRKNNEQTTESAQLRAFRLIDANRSDEAVALMLGEIEKDPNNPELRLTLASAYAHLVDIKVQTLVPLISSIRDFSRQIEDLKKLKEEIAAAEGSKNIFGDVSEAADMTASYLRVVASALLLIKGIPSVSGISIVHLREAIFHASYVKPVPVENAVYSALLLGIYIKTQIIQYIVLPNVGVDTRTKANCTIDMDSLLVNIQSTQINIKTLFLVLGDAFPEEKSRYEESAKSFDLQVSSLTNALTSLKLMDESSKVQFGEKLFSQGAGSLLLCGGEVEPD